VNASEQAPDRTRLLDVVRTKALRQFDEPRQLASGEMSRDFIDAKAGLSRGEDLRLACEVIDATVAGEGIGWDAVGGLTMGADQFAHGVALLHDEREWFVVRKQPKGRGTDQLV
jgi:orotate phosphoribosyltransferase